MFNKVQSSFADLCFTTYFYSSMVGSWSDLMIDIITQGKLPEVNVEPVQVFVHFMLNVSFESDSKDATMVGFWEKSQKIWLLHHFGQNLVGFLSLWRNLEEFSRNSEIYLHDSVKYLPIYFEYCCIFTLCCHQLQSNK